MDRPRILVVDDEPDILLALKGFLEGALDLEVVTADSGKAGLEHFPKGGIDLVISDYRMPVMNGIDFLREVQQREPEVPRVLLTAFPDMELAIRALNQAHIVQFLTKPVNPDKLHDVVKATLEQTRRTRQARKAIERAPSALKAREGDGSGPAPP